MLQHTQAKGSGLFRVAVFWMVIFVGLMVICVMTGGGY